MSFRAKRSAVEKSGCRAISIVPAVTEVVPVRILLCNQSELFFTPPSLELLFSGYAGGCIAKGLDIDEHIDVIAACEALEKPFFVLPDSLANIAGESNVQST